MGRGGGDVYVTILPPPCSRAPRPVCLRAPVPWRDCVYKFATHAVGRGEETLTLTVVVNGDPMRVVFRRGWCVWLAVVLAMHGKGHVTSADAVGQVGAGAASVVRELWGGLDTKFVHIHTHKRLVAACARL